jgi:dihydroxyacetone kinase-like protein
MSESLDFDGITGMLIGAVEAIESGHEELSRLDSLGGDGDHGTTMLRAMRKIRETVESFQSGSVRDLLEQMGWSVLGIDGGATGPLLGMFFTGMSEAATGRRAFDAEDLASLFQAGLASVESHTRARVGDKTMMDALIPAVEAIQADGDIVTRLRRAAEAATIGASSTEGLEARFGRAKNLGPRSVGNRDPGAMSVALIFRGFLRGVERDAG